MTPEELRNFRDTAKAGERAVYFRGHLANINAFVIKEIIAQAYLSGWFDIAQKRCGPDDYEYIIVRRRKKDVYQRFWSANTKDLQNNYHKPQLVGSRAR